MKLKDIPVYLDLLSLPLPVLWSRISKRVLPSGGNEPQEEWPDVALSGRSLFHLELLPVSSLSLNKWRVLLDHYLQDELNFLGSGWTSIRNEDAPINKLYGKFPRQELGNSEPDWNRDQRTGFQYTISGDPGNELQSAFEAKGVDVKWCWEFSRMHHLPQMALGTHIFPELKEQCAKKISQHLESFNTQCPYGKGINWSSPMEVAIRLVNILAAYEIAGTDASLGARVEQMALEHWFFIKNNLEDKDGFGTNHYLANLMGLIVAGLYLDRDEVRQTQSWAVGEFEFELTKQFHEDGMNFEYSTYYHRLSSEITMLSLLAALRSGYRLQQRSMKILEKALEALGKMEKPDGCLPQFGDNDSGRILDLDPAGVLKSDFEPVPEQSTFCTSLLREPGVYRWMYEDLLRRLPEEEYNHSQDEMELQYKKLPFQQDWKISYPAIDTQSILRYDFAEAGLYVFRGEQFYLSINLMSNPDGHRYRGHMHNDKSAFELWVKDKNLVRDPGIFSYTASVDERNAYRSTAAHPVPYTGVEQNRFLHDAFGLFHMKLDVNCELLEISRLSLTAKISYRGVKHIRKFQIFEDHLLITDFCNKKFTINKNPEVLPASGYGKKI